MSSQHQHSRRKAVFCLLLLAGFSVALVTGCGFNRYHQYVLPDTAAEKPVAGWTIIPMLQRYEKGTSGTIEEYTLEIDAIPTTGVERYRLGIDSVHILHEDGSILESQEDRIIMDDRQTERDAFSRTQPGIFIPTDLKAIICRLHFTMINIESEERWNRSADYLLYSHWKKDFWLGRRHW